MFCHILPIRATYYICQLLSNLTFPLILVRRQNVFPGNLIELFLLNFRILCFIFFSFEKLTIKISAQTRAGCTKFRFSSIFSDIHGQKKNISAPLPNFLKLGCRWKFRKFNANCRKPFGVAIRSSKKTGQRVVSFRAIPL